MRRSWMGLLAVLLVLGVAIGVASAADSPFEGTWKVLLPTKQFEVNLWLVKIDKAGKVVEVVASVAPQFKVAKPSDVKINDKSMNFILAPTGQNAFAFTMQPPSKDDKETLRGVVRIGSSIIGCWMEKTEQTEIDPKMAQQVVGAFGDLEAALKKDKADEKIKELYEVGKSHAGRPVGLLAYQMAVGELNKAKAGEKEYKELVKEYVKGVEGFGPLMVLGTNVQLSTILRGNKALLPLALQCAKDAVKSFNDDMPFSPRLAAQLNLAGLLVQSDKKDEAGKIAPAALKLAEEIIKRQPEAGKAGATAQMGQNLLGSPSDPVAEKGLELAQKAVKMLKEDAPILAKIQFNRLVLAGLKRFKKDDAAKALDASLVKMEDTADKEFASKNIAFKTEKFKREKGTRAVLVELFTGAQCPPCVSADIAFDAAAKTYAAKDVVLLQYHLHVPRPDPMTNADAEARQAYYGNEAVSGTPAVIIDGKAGPSLGGFRPHAEDRYKKLTEAVEKNLEDEAGATIKLDVKRDGAKLDLSAAVSGLKEAGEKVKLRFALVEESVRFTGSNGQRLHHHVVRALPGGAAGQALEKKEGTVKASVDLDALKKSLDGYLSGFTKKTGFIWPERPLNLAKLKVAAFIQDDESKKVVQAVIIDVPAK